MEPSRFDLVPRLLTRLGSRRTAVAVAASSVAMLAPATSSQAKNDVAADGKRRGRRGKRGRQGPPAGANAVVVSETCTLPAVGETPEVGDTAECTVLCEEGYVAISGGYSGPTFIDALGYVKGTYPNSDSGAPTGWITEMQFLELGQEFDVTTYAVCLPE
jgi:hypothetical protein